MNTQTFYLPDNPLIPGDPWYWGEEAMVSTYLCLILLYYWYWIWSESTKMILNYYFFKLFCRGEGPKPWERARVRVLQWIIQCFLFVFSMKSPECNSISVRLLNYSCALGLADDSYRFFSVANAQEKNAENCFWSFY